MNTNGNGTPRVVGVPTATASAEARAPRDDAPEFVMYIHNGEPIIYKRYDKE